MDSYRKSKELSQKMQECLRVYADMVGAPAPVKEAKYGFIPGLQMSVEEQVLEKQLDKLNDGIFQVLFTGGFSSGKSTLLNALMRKDILRTAITAETAVITKIVFGQDEKVIIYQKATDKSSGAQKTREMSVKQFFDEYRVVQDDPNKFENIDYVLLQQPEEGLGGSLVQLVDSPGTENSQADTMAARQFAKDASAIVHLINSTMPFIAPDKDYIATHYANRHMHNLFFVCNRFDSLNEQAQAALKESVRQQLHDVFVDENGKFDEELYRDRVFYTNAYGSLHARLGKPIKTPYGVVDIDDATTGVPEFEGSIGKFLTAGDRDVAAFCGYMPQLASKYVSAMSKIDSILADYRKGAEALMAERDTFESDKAKLDMYVSQIEESCRNCVAGILNSAKNGYDSCMNRIKVGWEDYFKGTKVEFHLWNMVNLAVHSKNEEKVREITKPFADVVRPYVKREFDQMGNELARDMDAQLKALKNQLEIIQSQIENLALPFSMDEIASALLGTMNRDKNLEIGGLSVGRMNILEVILGVIGGDAEGIANGLTGKNTTGKAILDFLIRNVIDYIAWYVVWWPIGLGMIGFRVWQAVTGVGHARNTMANDILLGMKDESVEAISKEKERYIQELENKLSALTRAGKTAADAIRVKADDYGASLDATIEKLNSQTSTLESETERTSKIKAKLLESISDMNVALNGAPLTDADVRKLAV